MCYNRIVKSPHQWTNKHNEVLLLKWVQKDGTAAGGFRYPLQIGSTVEDPSWNPIPKPIQGLHGYAWGICPKDQVVPDALWICFGVAPKDLVHLPPKYKCDPIAKCKAKKGVIRFVGSKNDALAYLAEQKRRIPQSE